MRYSSFCVLFVMALPACAPTLSEQRAEHAHEAPPPHLRAAVGRSNDEPPAGHADAVPDPTKTERVSLGAMLAYSDRHSPILAVARSTRSRADAAMVAASVVLPTNPELTVAVGLRYARGGRALDVDLGLMQQVQIAGERGKRVRAADRIRELTDAEIEEVRWAVHCDVHAAFHRALVEQDRARLAQQVVTFQEEVFAVVQRQIAAGETAPLTLRLAQAEVSQARQLWVGAKQGFLASRIQLAQLSGWPVQTPPSPEGTIDATQDPPAQERLIAVARERLPSLRTSAARSRAAEASLSVARSEGWPRPSLGVQYRHEGNAAGDGASDAILGAISLPIPSFDSNQGGRANARAEAAVAAAELSAAQQLLEGEIFAARSAVVAATERSRAYGTEILPRFEENLTLLRRSFELGEIDILALSTGRERFLSIQSDALGAQLDYFVALAALERVVGVDLWRDDHHEENIR